MIVITLSINIASAPSHCIDAVVILPDYTPPKYYTTPPPPPQTKTPIETPLDKLKAFLSTDPTDQHTYILSGRDTYVCTHYAADLAGNLSADGYDAGVVVRSAKWRNKGHGHLLTWTRCNNITYVIEPQNDHIMMSDDYNATIDTDIYVSRYESVASGRRKANEIYRRMA